MRKIRILGCLVAQGNGGPGGSGLVGNGGRARAAGPGTRAAGGRWVRARVTRLTGQDIWALGQGPDVCLVAPDLRKHEFEIQIMILIRINTC